MSLRFQNYLPHCRESNRQFQECKSKALRLEPAFLVKIIDLWPKKKLVAVTAVDVMPLA